MVENSAISWTDNSFNPWIGCQKVSPACDNCYAATLVNGRMKGNFYGERRRTGEANWQNPVKWNRKAAEAGVRVKVFCSSLADVFDNQVPEEWRADLWGMIRRTPHLDWQLLTKRPQNIRKMLPPHWSDGWPNVWLGTTVENQEEANRRIPHLLAVPARIHFLSCEPLLGPVSLRAWMDLPCDDGGTAWQKGGIDWVIAGAESGAYARPMLTADAESLLRQCQASGTPFWMKQFTGKNSRPITDMALFPEHLRVQQFPEMA
jgi:protein gp37